MAGRKKGLKTKAKSSGRSTTSSECPPGGKKLRSRVTEDVSSACNGFVDKESRQPKRKTAKQPAKSIQHSHTSKHKSDHQSQWGYTKDNGPHTWEEVAPPGPRKRQSPIDIIPQSCKYDKSLANKPLKWSYTPSNAKTLTNNGHSVQVTFDSDGSALEGGPLRDTYKLAQFHLHWGQHNSTGSEHRVNNKMYSAELHLVHWNCNKFSAVTEAMTPGGDLSVLGVFVKVGRENAGLKPVTDKLTDVCYSDTTVDLTEHIDPAALLPSDTSKYWTYAGSLTTPPLYETVTWIVFQEPIEVSQEQLDALRSLHVCGEGDSAEDEYHGMLVENYRPPLAVGRRTVRTTFQC